MPVPCKLYKIICISLLAIAAWQNACAQQQKAPDIVVAEMKYKYLSQPKDPNFTMFPPVPPRIAYATNDSMAQVMSNSLLQAINNRWGCQLAGLKLEVDKVLMPPITGIVKFKPKTKGLDKDKWHVFIDLYDEGRNNEYARQMRRDLSPPDPNQATVLICRVKVINGADGSESFSREILAKFVNEGPAGLQYVLEKLPGTSASFLAAFDSLAKLLFAPAAPDYIELPVKPACAFVPADTTANFKQRLRFASNGDTITQLEGNGFSWKVGQLVRQLKSENEKVVGNIAAGVFTTITGVGSEKTTVQHMVGYVGMQTVHDADSFLFEIPYAIYIRRKAKRPKWICHQNRFVKHNIGFLHR
jgi:hypothetical protein